jgi:hypothetical protein
MAVMAMEARARTCIIAAVLLLLSVPLLAMAQSSSASYEVPRQSVDGGAGHAVTASYALVGTIGQTDAGAVMSSASYALRGGFHRAGPAAPLPDALFADGFEPAVPMPHPTQSRE